VLAEEIGYPGGVVALDFDGTVADGAARTDLALEFGGQFPQVAPVGEVRSNPETTVTGLPYRRDSTRIVSRCWPRAKSSSRPSSSGRPAASPSVSVATFVLRPGDT
jgi:hypothetical protein